MEIKTNINMTTKDILTIRINSKKMKEAINETFKVGGIIIFEDDGKHIIGLKTDKGFYATNSKTFCGSFEIAISDEDVVKMIKDGILEVTVNSEKSNGNREFIFPVFVNL